MKVLLDIQYVPGLPWLIVPDLGCSSYLVMKKALGAKINYSPWAWENLSSNNLDTLIPLCLSKWIAYMMPSYIWISDQKYVSCKIWDTLKNYSLFIWNLSVTGHPAFWFSKSGHSALLKGCIVTHHEPLVLHSSPRSSALSATGKGWPCLASEIPVHLPGNNLVVARVSSIVQHRNYSGMNHLVPEMVLFCFSLPVGNSCHHCVLTSPANQSRPSISSTILETCNWGREVHSVINLRLGSILPLSCDPTLCFFLSSVVLV